MRRSGAASRTWARAAWRPSVGAHGKVARRLARLLVARGDRSGMIRNPAHVDDLRADGSEPVVCDLERVGDDELAGAISGADAVVFAAGAGPGSGPSASSPSTATGQSSCSMRHAPRTSSGTSWSAPSAPRTRPTATACSPSTCGRRPRPTGSSWPAIAPGPSCGRCSCRTSRDGRIRLAQQPLRGEVPRDDVAGVLAAVLPEPRSARRVLYVGADDDPIEEALARVLVSPFAHTMSPKFGLPTGSLRKRRSALSARWPSGSPPAARRGQAAASRLRPSAM
jgi:hypothetical protein